MLIGILGAGEVALAFSRYALRAGHQVRLSNSRGPESLKDVVKELGTGASAGTIREAAQAPIVLIAIPWPKVDEVLKSLPDKWENRILIDATNHFLLPSMEIADSSGRASLCSRTIPPGSSDSSAGRPFCDPMAKGRANHAESNFSRSECRYSSCRMVAGEGRSEAGASTNCDSDPPGGASRERMKSESSHNF